ncbi:MAG: hypothetical protein WCX64_01960 [Candidatus Micrarchaeia archaeon]
MVFGERNIRKDVKAALPGSDAEFLTGKTGGKPGPIGKKQPGQLTFEAFDKQIPQFTVQQDLSCKAGTPQTDQEYVRDHTRELSDLKKSYAARVNKYQVTPFDPDLKKYNVFLALEKHHLENRTSQANYAALIRRAKEHFSQGTHKEFVAELLKKGVLKSPIW